MEPTTTRRRPVPRRRPKPHCRGDAHGKSCRADPGTRRGQEEIRLGRPATLHERHQTLPQNWGAPNTALRHGKPEWGRFWFRKDNPLTSTSGLAATIATYKVANSLIDGRGPDQVSDLPPEAFRNEKLTTFVRRVEAGIPPSGYAYDATQMMKDLASEDLRMPGGGWSDTSAVVVQEQFVYLYNANKLPYTPNEKAPDRAPVQPLVPLYPASGTLMMDHPYVQMAGLAGDKKSIADGLPGVPTVLRTATGLFGSGLPRRERLLAPRPQGATPWSCPGDTDQDAHPNRCWHQGHSGQLGNAPQAGEGTAPDG